MRLIDADALIAKLQKRTDMSRKDWNWDLHAVASDFIEILEAEPTIVERKHGHWVYDDPFGALPKCSECGRRSHDAAAEERATPYCPHCGAVMNEEADDGH